jgi:recombination protein RecA
MKRAALLREQIESSLTSRFPVALTPRARIPLVRVACGLPAVDALLQGGLPEGVITELAGAECSGRTSMALAYAAALTRSARVCAWVDAGDALDPESAAANGVELERLLWVRCGQAARSPEANRGNTGGVLKAVATGVQPAPPSGCGGLHPRSEGRDMPQALTSLLLAGELPKDGQARREKKRIGTPGMPNRPLTPDANAREEQVNADRLPPRRSDNLTLAPRCAEPMPRRVAGLAAPAPRVFETAKPAAVAGAGSWQALDQALRATDLLLQGGGFSAIVLDLGGVAPEIAWRVPMATWFRFRAACERSRASLLLLTQHPCARSSAELVVRLEAGTMEADGITEAYRRVLTAIRYRAQTERSRTQGVAEDSRVIPIRKPPQSVHPAEWRSEAAWVKTQ